MKICRITVHVFEEIPNDFNHGLQMTLESPASLSDRLFV